MDNPEERERFAELYSRGLSRKEIAAEFGIHIDTVTEWSKREDVRAVAERLMKERVQKILRKIDSAIEAAINQADDLSLDELLRVRREFVPQEFKFTGKMDSTPALEELLAAYLADPESTIAKLQRAAKTDAAEE
jgi:hypothetical protein